MEIIHMRIDTGKTDNEVIMRSHGWRRKGTDEILKERIKVQVITPVVNRGIAKVLHEDKRTNEYRRINGWSSCMGIQGEEKIRSQLWVQLLEFVQSRTI
jgi:hypothetical protein